MLKITYLEDAINLEYLDRSIEDWKAERVLVNLRAAASIYAESSIASLILPISADIYSLLKLAENQPIELVPCDEDYIEIGLLGIWMAEQEDSEEGVFVCELNEAIEHCLYRIWEKSRLGTSVTN